MKRLLVLVAVVTAAVVGVLLWRRTQGPMSSPVSPWIDPVPPEPLTPTRATGEAASEAPPDIPREAPHPTTAPPADKAPADKSPADKSPADKPPAKKAAAKKSPAKRSPAAAKAASPEAHPDAAP